MHNKAINFTKMHGLGNDFVVINTLDQSVDKTTTAMAKLANRHTGVGSDQILLIEPSKQADFFCRIFNADGSEAEQCGNGLRCVARFIKDAGLSQTSFFTIETRAGIHPVTISNETDIRIGMGIPQIIAHTKELTLPTHEKWTATVISMGNPHAILQVEAVDTAPVQTVGAVLTKHAAFPQGANIGFMQVVNPEQIRLRTYERGAGETFACGSNACAAVAAGILHGWLKPKATVQFQQGILTIEWAGEGKPLFMSGPATKVFDGVLSMSA